MSNDLKQLKVGDTVWVVGHQYTGRREKGPVPMTEGKVIKVGRKYLTVETDPEAWNGTEEFTIATGWNKGREGYSQTIQRKLYLDIHAYAEEQRRKEAERQLTSRWAGWGGHSISPEVTTEDILAAAKLLRITIDLEGKKE